MIVVSIKHYIDTRIDEVQKQLDRRVRAVEREGEFQNDALKRELSVSIDTQKEARDKAEETIDHRLEGMNEFRQALTDQQATFLTADLYDERHGEIEKRLRLIENWQSNILGRTIVVGSILLVLLTIGAGLAVHLIGGSMLLAHMMF